MTFQPVQIILFVCIAVVFWQIVGALRSGRVAATRKVHFSRQEQPVKFWGISTVQVAMLVGMVWFAFRPMSAKPLSEDAKIYAVTAAVREEIVKGRSPAFRNVRADAESGFVCGELNLEGSRQRFFGNVADGGARATIEEQDRQQFSTNFARLCGSEWVLPPTR